jgi:DNA-binding GntR family transcriptional regulator
MFNETKKIDQITEEFRKRILAKVYGTDGRLPTVRMLAEQFQVSRDLMDKALLRLQAEGLLVSHGRAGLLVNLPQPRTSGVTPSFNLELGRENLPLIQVNLEDPITLAASEEVANLLQVEEGASVVRRFLRQGTEQVTYRAVEEFYPLELVRSFLPDKIKRASFDVLAAIREHLGMEVEQIYDDLVARLPALREQGWLNVVRNTPIVEVKRVGYSGNHKPLVFSRLLCVANLTHFPYKYTIPQD